MWQVDPSSDRRSCGLQNGRAEEAGASLMRSSLWIAPDLWKTHRTRFPQGRWTQRTRPHAPQAYFLAVIMKKNKNESRKMMRLIS
jgi:hypothetical protein